MLHIILSSLGIIEDKRPILCQAIREGDEAAVDAVLRSWIRPKYIDVRAALYERQRNVLILAFPYPNILNKLLQAYSDEISAEDYTQALENAALHDRAEIVTAVLQAWEASADRLMQFSAIQLQTGDLFNFAENSTVPLVAEEKQLLKHLREEYGEIYANRGWKQLHTEILSYLEVEYQKAPACDGYSRVWMLPKDSKIPVTFLPADTIGLHPTGEDCTIYWHDEKGVLHQKTVPCKEVEEVYASVMGQEKEFSYFCQMFQEPELLKAIIERFNIPVIEPKILALEKKEALSAQALVAYYRHPIHNAWRYLSPKNPWMSPDAAWVSVGEADERAAAIAPGDQALMGYLWLALNDKELELEAGFTVEGNLQVFAAVIAELNRGHNVDERALYKDGIETTREDDLKADRPTCQYGVTKRLFQSQYGHPLTRGLDNDILREWMVAQVIKHRNENADFDNLFDKLDKVSVDILKDISNDMGSYGMSCIGEGESSDVAMLDDEAMTQKKQALKISEEQLEASIKALKRYFSKVRIEEAHDPKIKDYFTQKDYATYEEMARDWASKPELAFATVVMKYLNERIALLEAEAAPPIVLQFDKGKEEDKENKKRKREPESGVWDGRLRKRKP